MSPSTVTRNVETTFTIKGMNLGSVTEVIAEDTYQEFEIISDTEIAFTGALGGDGEVALHVVGPDGESNRLTIKVLAPVWTVPADDLTITYGQEANLKGVFSRLTTKYNIYFLVGYETFTADLLEGERAAVRLNPRLLDAGEYPVSIGSMPPGRAAAASSDDAAVEAGTLRVLKSPTQISYGITDQVLTAKVGAKFDSVPTGDVSISFADGAQPVTFALDDTGAFTLPEFTRADDGFEIAYAGDKNHEASAVTVDPAGPLTPPVIVDPPTTSKDTPAAQGGKASHDLAATGSTGFNGSLIGLGVAVSLLGAASIAFAQRRRSINRLS